ncbi:MAG: hypothetical protein AAF560_27325, partial [Acidobacteriota bacterium]
RNWLHCSRGIESMVIAPGATVRLNLQGRLPKAQDVRGAWETKDGDMAVARALTLVYFLIAALAAAIFASSVLAEPSGKKAPQWEISEWINSEPINLSEAQP